MKLYSDVKGCSSHSSFICWKLEGDTLENSCQWRCFQNCFQTISTTSQIFVSAKWLFFIPNYSQRTGSWGVMRRWCEDCEANTALHGSSQHISSFSHVNSIHLPSSIIFLSNKMHTKTCPITNCKQTFLKANSHSDSVQCNKVVCIYHRHKRAPGYTIPFEPSWKCQIVLSCRVEVFVSCRLRWKFEMWIFVTRYRLHSNFPPHSWSVMIWEPRLHGSQEGCCCCCNCN